VLTMQQRDASQSRKNQNSSEYYPKKVARSDDLSSQFLRCESRQDVFSLSVT
jgi:hypothetical protein